MSRGARGPGASSKCRHTARSSPGLPQSAAQELAAPPLSLRSAVSEGYGPAVLRARFHQVHHRRGPYRRSRPPRQPCPPAQKIAQERRQHEYQRARSRPASPAPHRRVPGDQPGRRSATPSGHEHRGPQRQQAKCAPHCVEHCAPQLRQRGHASSRSSATRGPRRRGRHGRRPRPSASASAQPRRPEDAQTPWQDSGNRRGCARAAGGRGMS